MSTPPKRPTRAVNPSAQERTLRAIATLEGIKGLAALASGIGMLSLLHHNLRHLALELVGHFGLNPAQHYPALLLHYVDLLNSSSISTVMLLAAGYASLRFTESYGLWHERSWGEWLGAFSGGIYIPFELRHLWHQPGVVSALVLMVNLAVVAFLVDQLRRRRALTR